MTLCLAMHDALKRWNAGWQQCVFALAAVTMLLTCRPATAQDALKIAAVVNDDAISVYDLAQRITLVALFSNLPNTPEMRGRIAPDVLGRLIVEKLRLQEAKRLDINIDNAEINESVAKMEKDNHLPDGKMEDFLKQRGIDIETLQQQIRSDLAWVRVVNELFRPISTVSEAEVDEVLSEIRRNEGKQEYQVSEIFLAYDEKSKAETSQAASRIHSQLTSGASFPQLAQNFSQAASAQNGGNIGWTTATELGPVLAQAIQRMRPGQISAPITTEDGIYILALQDVRATAVLGQGAKKTTVKLQQLHLSLAPNASAGDISAAMARAQSLANGIRSCDDLGKIGASQGSPQSGPLGEFDVATLAPAIRDTVQNLPEMTPSNPIRTADGVAVMMVCSRKTDAGPDPVAEARARIRSRLLNERLSRAADQHMAKLRRQAFIDIRL